MADEIRTENFSRTAKDIDDANREAARRVERQHEERRAKEEVRKNQQAARSRQADHG